MSPWILRQMWVPYPDALTGAGTRCWYELHVFMGVAPLEKINRTRNAAKNFLRLTFSLPIVGVSLEGGSMPSPAILQQFRE